ncbi:formate transporter FocA [Celerinatantimonas diazotrophica]|uniref:Formate transporter FocA n=1 Tax=Celerinatantimonas diazotrophica TaxID=412034 RepID=A0A4R1J7U0_9GAMM|nr:formate transporter FocA [Celerinatantimonas diazotrophica]TCK46542.1 formate transporter [Celerinatantimonas diazotrophica]CAG9296592.1 putative formate transporter 1 [Celerinatantimonas diazotrophica]
MNQQLSGEAISPAEMTAQAKSYGHKKIVKDPNSSFLLAIAAGMFIALAFVFYTTVTTGSGNSGLAHLAGGIVFSMGLILVVLCGTELFTSTVLSLISRVNNEVSTTALLNCWVRVYFGNMVGSLFIVLLIMGSGTYLGSQGQWGLSALHLAEHKIHHTFIQAFTLGVLCNMMVCLAVWLTFATRNPLAKAMLMILPVAMFVASGFEHCVANMFMIPMGISIHYFADASFWQAIGIPSQHFADLTISNFIINNLIPVTLGNIVGGAVIIGLGFWTIFKSKVAKSKHQESTAAELG